MPLNFEFKAQTTKLIELENLLESFNPQYKGEDHQLDTYFNVTHGRMKLRQGNIENALIHYHRRNLKDAKTSEVILYEHQPSEHLKDILVAALGIKAVVDKRRKIYFIDNVKFHFDTVLHLGTFVEVEAIDRDGNIGVEKLKEQCLHYKRLFNIDDKDLIAESYSDMIISLHN